MRFSYVEEMKTILKTDLQGNKISMMSENKFWVSKLLPFSYKLRCMY